MTTKNDTKIEDLYKSETGKEAWLATGPDDHWTREPAMEVPQDYIDWLEEKVESQLETLAFNAQVISMQGF